MHAIKMQGVKTVYMREVKGLCNTRWVERHTLFFYFWTLFGATNHCLGIITQNDDESK